MALTLDSLVENFLEVSGRRFMDQNDPEGNYDRGVLLGEIAKRIEAEGGLEADVVRDLKANTARMSDTEKDKFVDRVWDRIAPTRDRFRKYNETTINSLVQHFNRQGQSITPEQVRAAADAFRSGQDNSPLAIVAASAMNPANYTDDGFQFPKGYLDEVYRGEPLERAKVEEVLGGIDTEIRRGAQKDFQSTQSLLGRALPLTSEALSRTSSPDMVELERQKIERQVRAEAGNANSEDAIQAEIDRRLQKVAQPSGFGERAVETAGSAVTDVLKMPDRIAQGAYAATTAPPGEIISEGMRAMSNTGLIRGSTPGVNDPVSEGEQAAGEFLGTVGSAVLGGGLPMLGRGAVRGAIGEAIAPRSKLGTMVQRALPSNKVSTIIQRYGGGEDLSRLAGGRTSLEKAVQAENRADSRDMFSNADVNLPPELRALQGPLPSAAASAGSSMAASASDPNSNASDMALAGFVGGGLGLAGGYATQFGDKSQPQNLYQAAIFDKQGFTPNNQALIGELVRGERSLGAGPRGQAELDRVIQSADEVRQALRPQVAEEFANDFRTGYRDRTVIEGDPMDVNVAKNPKLKELEAEPSKITEIALIENAMQKNLISAEDRAALIDELKAQGRYSKTAVPGTVAPEETTRGLAPVLDASGNPIVGKSGIPLRQMQTTTTPERVVDPASIKNTSVPFTSDPENRVVNSLLARMVAKNPRVNAVEELYKLADDVKGFAAKNAEDGVKGAKISNPNLAQFGKFEQTLSAVKDPSYRKRMVDDALSAKSAQGSVPDEVRKSATLVSQLESVMESVPWKDKATAQRAMKELKTAVESFKTYMADQADLQRAYQVWAEKLTNPSNAVVQMLRTEGGNRPFIRSIGEIVSSIPEIYAGKLGQSVSAEYSADDENKLNP